MTDPRDLLAAAIARRGMSASRFAREVLTRDPRTVRRWQLGVSPISAPVLKWLHEDAERADRATRRAARQSRVGWIDPNYVPYQPRGEGGDTP